MTNDEQSKPAADKPAAESAAKTESAEEQAAKPKKVVRRSGNTRDSAFSAPATEGEAPSTEASQGGDKPRPRATLDMRAPRPKPGEARPQRPRSGEGRPPRGRDRGDFRPPEARPAGMRPVPGGPRAPASPARSGGGGDYKPPAARPVGMRPAPGGPRAPARDNERGPGRDRPRRPGPRGEAPAQKPAAPRGEAPKAAAPAAAPKPVQPAAAKPTPPKPEAPKPLPLRIPTVKTISAPQKPVLTPKEALAAKTKAHAAKKQAAKSESQAAKAAEAKSFDAAVLEVGQEGALDALKQAGDAATALVDAWLAASNAAAIVAVAEADEATGPARKAARRALNVLRSRGVTIPEKQHIARPIDDRAEVSVEATMTPPDGTGTIAVTITSRDAAGRYHLAEVIIREPLGIIQAGSGWLSGSQLKEGRARTVESLGVAPVNVPVEWARHRIASALKLNASSRYVVPLGLERCRELIEPVPENEPAHPLSEIENAITPERVQEVANTSIDLHNEPEFRAWLPDRGALDELLQKLGARLGPQGVGDPAEVGKALSEEMEAATDRFFSPEVREIVANRMRDAAISLRARKGDERAAFALATARAVREAGLITSPPREVGFLLAFFQKGISILAQQGGGQLSVPVAAPPPAASAPTEEPPAEATSE